MSAAVQFGIHQLATFRSCMMSRVMREAVSEPNDMDVTQLSRFFFHTQQSRSSCHVRIISQLYSDLRDLRIEMVTEEVRRFARKQEERLLNHDNVEAIQLLDNGELTRRLRRTKPFELV
jgi:hypothetical protein